MTNSIAKVAAQLARQRVDAVLAHPEQDLIAGAAAERQQARLLQVGEIDQHARAEAERPDAAARLLRDDAADRERLAADQEPIADGDAELRQQLRPDQRAATLSRSWEYGAPPCSTIVP